MAQQKGKTYAADETKLPTKETAYSDAYAISRFREATYNPDDLIGRKGFAIYKKMMQDEQVKAVTRFKRDAITARDWYFDLDTDELSDDEKARRIRVCEEIVSQMDGAMEDALNGIISSMYNGFSMTEKTYRMINVDGLSYWGIKHLRVKPFDTFYFETDKYGNLDRLRQKVQGDELVLDINKFIHHVNNPDIDEWYGQSELREAHRSWYSKDIILKIQNIYLERYASGFNVVTPPEGRNIEPGSKDHTQLMQVLDSIQSGSALLLPSGFTVTTVYPNGDPGYDKAINYHDLAIAKSLLVPNLLGISYQGDTGSYSQSQTQLEAFLWVLDSDAARLREALNEQLFKPLGRVNFGDELTPVFKFKPLSKQQIYELAKNWRDLVSGGAVKASDADEQHLRDMLGFPERADEDDAGAVNPQTALNGIQVQAMVEVIRQMGAGNLPKTTAVEILVASFPVSREQAERLVADVEVRPTPQTPPQGGQGEPPRAEPTRPDGQVATEDDGTPQGVPEPVDETIAGRGGVSVSAFTKAEKRVDFAVIQRTSEAVEEERAAGLATVMEGALVEVMDTFEGEALGEDDLATITALTFKPEQKRALRNEVRRMLEDAWRIGERHARDEIDKAKGEAFSIGFTRKKLKFISEEFFDIKSFTITGALSDDILNKIKNVLLNGAKGGKSTREVRRQIIDLAVSEGIIGREFAEQQLGRVLNAESNPRARLNNIVRTNTFEAINEARFAYFSDPQVDDFVEALEYSSILDSRTTNICEHMDGRTYEKGSEIWNSYRPPNHYQCRSLLIPVTVNDTWTPSEPPTLTPQKGFD